MRGRINIAKLPQTNLGNDLKSSDFIFHFSFLSCSLALSPSPSPSPPSLLYNILDNMRWGRIAGKKGGEGLGREGGEREKGGRAKKRQSRTNTAFIRLTSSINFPQKSSPCHTCGRSRFEPQKLKVHLEQAPAHSNTSTKSHPCPRSF